MKKYLVSMTYGTFTLVHTTYAFDEEDAKGCMRLHLNHTFGFEFDAPVSEMEVEQIGVFA